MVIYNNLQIFISSFILTVFLQHSSSQLVTILSPRGHLTISGDIFVCHNWGGGMLVAFLG